MAPIATTASLAPPRQGSGAVRLRPPACAQDLHLAVRFNDVQRVRKIIHGVCPNKRAPDSAALDVNTVVRSSTALSIAVLAHSEPIVRLLLDAGADLDALSVDRLGRRETPLFTACRTGHAGIARLLLRRGAHRDTPDSYGHSPLWAAVREKRPEIVRLLIDHGAVVGVVERRGGGGAALPPPEVSHCTMLLQQLLAATRHVAPEAGGAWASCPLFLAAKYSNRAAIARLLIYHGAPLDVRDPDGRDALYWAAENRDVELVSALLDAGAKVTHRRRSQAAATAEPWMAALTPAHRAALTERPRPLDLQALCRHAIRDALRRNARGASPASRVDQLRLPPSLHGFVKMEFLKV